MSSSASAEEGSSSGSRLDFVDNVRVLLVLLVVAHHAAQPYLQAPSLWWWTTVPGPPLHALHSFTRVNAAFFMGLFFLIAGLFTPAALERKGPARFAAERALRLGVPLLFGVSVMIPLLGYVHHVTVRELTPAGGFPEYFLRVYLGLGGRPADWTEERWPDLQLGHLWFLEHLLIYGLLCAAAAALLPARPAAGPAARRAAPPGHAAIACYAVLLALVTWAVRTRFPQDHWVAFLGFVQMEPAHLPQYASLFVLGLVAGRRDWVRRIPLRVGVIWLAIGLALAAADYGLTLARPDVPTDLNGFPRCLWEAFVASGLCVGLLITARAVAPRSGPFARTLRDNAYAVYVFHVPVVVALQIAFASTAWSSWSQALATMALGIVGSFALCHFAIRRLPYARNVL